MFDEQDQELGPVLTLVIGIAIVVSLFTIAIALAVSGVFPSGSSAATAGAPLQVDPIRIYFAPGSSDLSKDAAGALFPIAVAAVIDPARHVVLSGFRERGGDGRHDAELAKARAVAVRDALKAAGIAENRIELRTATEAAADGDAREARRVDVGLR